jgi:hypothetical protein
MADFDPITLRAIDHKGRLLLEQAVVFRIGITAREVLEEGFVLGQTSTDPDPFVYTLQYFGYSESAAYPGYLGYEVESICQYANSPDFFWDLLVNGQPAASGADTTYPNPGSEVTWQYTALQSTSTAGSRRAALIHNRRKARA